MEHPTRFPADFARRRPTDRRDRRTAALFWAGVAAAMPVLMLFAFVLGVIAGEWLS